MGEFKKFVVHYGYQGHQWGLLIDATSPEDAEERLKAIGSWGRVDGEHVMTVPDVPGAGFLVGAMTWVRNLFGGKGWDAR